MQVYLSLSKSQIRPKRDESNLVTQLTRYPQRGHGKDDGDWNICRWLMHSCGLWIARDRLFCHSEEHSNRDPQVFACIWHLDLGETGGKGKTAPININSHRIDFLAKYSEKATCVRGNFPFVWGNRKKAAKRNQLQGNNSCTPVLVCYKRVLW